MASSRPVAAGDHVFLVDGSSFIFRAYFQSMNQDQKYNSRSSDGMPTGAVRLFCHEAAAIHARRRGRARSRRILPSCSTSPRARSARSSTRITRATGPIAPEDLKVQMPIMREAIRAFGLEPVELRALRGGRPHRHLYAGGQGPRRRRADHLLRQGPDAARGAAGVLLRFRIGRQGQARLPARAQPRRGRRHREMGGHAARRRSATCWR